jgi:alanyl-tRNA synthetase
MRNHTATHLLNLGLRQILGDHVDQKGSLVDDEKTRFDFSHDKPLTPQEIQQLETFVNSRITADLPVAAKTMPLTEAKQLPGVRAVFGEKYPDPVRVVMIGAESPEEITSDLSVEFCGGTHLNRTGSIGYFKITGQEGVAKGVRRLTAVTGRSANQQIEKLAKVTQELSEKLNCRLEEIPTRVESLHEELRKLQKQLQKGIAADLNTVGDSLLASAKEINGSKFIVGEVPSAPVDQLKSQIDRLKTKAGSGVVILLWKGEEGNGILVGVTEDLIKRGMKAGDIIKPIAEAAGGKGGGPPTMAQAGIKDASKLPAALAKAMEAGEKLGQ